MRIFAFALFGLIIGLTSCKKDDDESKSKLRIVLDRGVYPVHDANVRLFGSYSDYQSNTNILQSGLSIKFTDSDDAYIDFEGLEQQVYYFKVLSNDSPWGHNDPTACSGSSNIKNETNGPLIVGSNEVTTRLCYN